jgi:hypothetical protein
VSFWCSATGVAWTWQWRAYPGVWLFIILMAFGMWAWNRAGGRAAGRAPRPVHPAFVGGLIVLWLSLDWPIGALGALPRHPCSVPAHGPGGAAHARGPIAGRAGVAGTESPRHRQEVCHHSGAGPIFGRRPRDTSAALSIGHRWRRSWPIMAIDLSDRRRLVFWWPVIRNVPQPRFGIR